MSTKINIRNETDADIRTITEVTISAFKNLEISDHTEQFIIEALRVAEALTLSLVAEIESLAVMSHSMKDLKPPDKKPLIADHKTSEVFRSLS